MSAREEARTAARPSFVPAGTAQTKIAAAECAADAASDVWEPLLREAIEAIPVEHLEVEDCWYSCATLTCDDERRGDVCDCGAAARQELVARLREATAT